MKLTVGCILLVVIALVGSLRVFAQASAQENELITCYETIFTDAEQDTLSRLGGSLLQAPAPEWHAMLSTIPGDWFRMGQRTFRLESLPAIGGIAAATGLLYLADHETFQVSHSAYENSDAVRSASDVIEHFGDGRTAFGLAGAFALYGFIEGDHRALRTASQTVEAVIASGIVVQLLKRVTGRESPEMSTEHRGAWRPLPNWKKYNSNQPKYYAFPSGHITTTMAVVTVITENYPEVKWLKPVGYTIVGLVAISLANRGWHWYSDYPLGIALGYSFGMMAAHRDEPEPGTGDFAGGHGLTILPTFTSEGVGVALALSF